MSNTHSEETMESLDRFSGSTLTSSRFRESTRLIPSPGTQGKPPKPYKTLYMSLPILIGAPLSMLLLGVALEVAIFISNHNNGFKVPQNNVFNAFGNVSAQFLASFFPTLLIIPLAVLWRELDWYVRWYQPYVTLYKGSATAEESLLLNYVLLGPFLAVFRALHYRHRTVFWSAMTAVLTYTFQPLTGSIFQIRQAPSNITGLSVTSIKSINMSTDGILDRSSFVAAAGYTDASAVLNNIGDPPFVFNGWATAEAVFPANKYLNGTITVNTSGIQTNVNCSNPISPLNFNVGPSTSVTISATSTENCNFTNTFDTVLSTSQYGVGSVQCPGSNISSRHLEMQPVAFWFYNFDASKNQQTKIVFCSPIIKAFEVQAVASLNNGSLETVTGLGPYTGNNDIFSPPQNGIAYNGVLFSTSNNPFIQARANATNSIVPGAIFKAAARDPNGLSSVFSSPNGFLTLTQLFYLRHLSVLAKAIYFVDNNSTLTAVSVDSLLPRLIIDPLPAHLLSLLMILVGLIGLPLHIRYRTQREKLLLATAPGSIASIVALTSRSGFGELLLPYDDELTLEKKLDGLRFRLDRRTGAILAEDYGSEREGMGMGPEDAMLSLLGGKLDPHHPAAESSSSLAYQAAIGTLPWERSWAPGASEPPQAKSPLSRTEYVP